jgi:hypothetical protein
MTTEHLDRAVLEERVREAKDLRNARRTEANEAKARLQEAETAYLEALAQLEECLEKVQMPGIR